MSDDPRLPALLARRDEMRQRGETIVLEALCHDCPELLPALREQLELDSQFEAVPQTLEMPGASSSDADSPPTVLRDFGEEASKSQRAALDSRPPGPPQVPGYEVLGELGRGGMGVVYKARHLRLNRLVALKMVLAGAHAGTSQLIRFQIEAQSVASLHHSNIVQVYDDGIHDHCPYLALEYVDGGGLDEKLAGKRMAPHEAAQLVETLARAMHAAHLRGIIHRDLKPANVLLTADGTPKISDFGLAKNLEGEQSQTHSGSVLGTPSYMAPEQALGRVREVGPHSDVYSLGAILYECLAGQPPFQAESVMQTLTLVQTEEVTPPSRVAKTPLPRDLETICMKCLHKAPARRYPSALELADDLARFLNREPIRARPVGRMERLAMWVKRRPAVAGLVGVSLVAMIALAALGFWAHLRVRDQRDRAERRTAIARKAIDDMYVKVAEQWLGDEPMQDKLQHEFLLNAVRLYEQMAKEDDDDPSLRRETGKAQLRMGQIYRQLGEREKAERAFERAVDTQKVLVEENPRDADYRQDLANTHNWRGEMYRTTNRPNEAIAEYQQSMRLQRELAEEFRDRANYRHELGRSHYNHALVLASLGKTEPARSEYDEAIELLEGVCQTCDGEPGPSQDLARAYLNLGALLRKMQKFDAAKTAYQQATRRIEGLLGEHANKPEYRFELAVALNNLGNVQGYGLKDPTAALKAHDEGRKLLDRLVEEFPARPKYTEELANTYNSLGAIHSDRKHFKEAAKVWQRSADLFQGLVDKHDEQVEYLQGVGMARGNLGWVYLRHLQDAGVAVNHLEAGMKFLAQAAQKTRTDNAGIWRDRAPFVRYLADAALALHDPFRAAIAAQDLGGIHSNDKDRYSAACLLVRCAEAVVKENSGGTVVERKARAQKLEDEAVLFLRQVNPNQFPSARQADRDPSLAPLRDREDFRSLIAMWKTGQTLP